MDIKVSVIIPVYNAEQYIEQCIESLLSQTLQECEFIFINDGSTDHSSSMIKRYQNKDHRIRLVIQENQGVSIARNVGLELASGEYIGFVDADDYIDKDMYETLYCAAVLDDCDVVIANLESIKYPFPINIVFDKPYIQEHLLPYLLKSDNLNTAVNKIYKNKMIQEQHVKFPEKVALGEDGIFNMHFMSLASAAKYIEYVGYHYRDVAGSATRNIAVKDYFGRSLEIYHMDFPEPFTGLLDKAKIRELKSIKLIHSVITYIHVYFTPSKDLGFRKRYQYIKNMICNPCVREALPVYIHHTQDHLGRYERLIIDLVMTKSAIGLYFATAYSRFRNK